VSVPARRPIKPVYVRRFVTFIEAVRASNGDTQYRFTVRPLTRMKRGYLIEFPICPAACRMADDSEAIANGEDAKRCWIAAMKEAGRPIRRPRSKRPKATAANGSCARRIAASPARRTRQAEGVSLNTWPSPCSPKSRRANPRLSVEASRASTSTPTRATEHQLAPVAGPAAEVVTRLRRARRILWLRQQAAGLGDGAPLLDRASPCARASARPVGPQIVR